MNIPQSQYLNSQNFRSDKIEFVWKFKDSIFILQVKKDATIIIYAGNDTFSKNCNINTLDSTLLNPKCWIYGKLPEEYKFFSNGKDLIPLVIDVMEFFHQSD